MKKVNQLWQEFYTNSYKNCVKYRVEVGCVHFGTRQVKDMHGFGDKTKIERKD